MDIFVILNFVISIIIGVITIPNIVLISKKKRLFDTLNSRKSHTKGDVPRLGGVSFIFALFFSFCFMLGLRDITGHSIDSRYYAIFNTEFMFFVAGSMLLFFVGLSDDLIEVNYKVKFLVQILAATMLSISDLYIHNLQGLFGIYEISPFIGIPLSVITIVLVVNSYNLIDGIDGLCSGLAITSIGTLSVWFWINGIHSYAMLGLSLTGCLFSFFFYNVSKKRLKVFMGDAGSLIIGYLICYLGLKFINISTAKFIDYSNSVVIALSIMFVPVFDTVRVFIDRIRKGKTPFLPDKTHIHHLILKLGFTHLQSTAIIIFIAVKIMVINFLCRELDINILFAIDMIYGFVMLSLLPKLLIRKGIVFNTRSKNGSKREIKRKHNNVILKVNHLR